MIHGWADVPDAGWLGWLAEKLSAQGFSVAAPHLLPNGMGSIDGWLKELTPLLLAMSEPKTIVAHSLGCWLAMRLLAEAEPGLKIDRLILVSGFTTLGGERAKHFLGSMPDWGLVRSHCRQIICLYSDDDTIVTPDRTKRLARFLSAELICMPSHGHFLGSRGMNEFPELLNLMLD